MVNNKTLASYVDAMKQASDIVIQINPDFLVSPMLGSVPFIDAMAIINRDFDPSKVVYMPASSRIDNVNQVIADWYYNFLDHVSNEQTPFPNILGIDEVVSGASVIRCVNNIDLATERKRKNIRQTLVERLYSPSDDVALSAVREIDMLTENSYSMKFAEIRERIAQKHYSENRLDARADSDFTKDVLKTFLAKQLVYRTIGIEDSKADGKKAVSYDRYKSDGRIIPVHVEKIISMDLPDFCPPQFVDELNPNGRSDYVRFGPRIKDFKVTPSYIAFLRSIAKYVGADPEKVSPVNMSAILNSDKYLSGSKR